MNYKQFWDLVGVKSHHQYDQKLRELIFNKKQREDFYRGMIKVNNDASVDIFKPYFELYSAERKTNQQDYTPDSVSRILSILTRQGSDDLGSQYTAMDMTAGTGTLLIAKWWDDMTQETPWTYVPHRYFYYAEELADNSIPFLIHNLTLRGMNAIVFHGDSLSRECHNIYFIQNSTDDFLRFSDINVLPRSQAVTEHFNVEKWVGEPIEHIESGKVIWHNAPPMMAEKFEVSTAPPKFLTQPAWKNAPTLSELGFVEQAIKGKMYPKGSIAIQLSATRGQFHLLDSDGQVDTKYAMFVPHYYVNGEFIYYYLSNIIPKWFHMRQQGLNMTIEDIEQLPLTADLFREKIYLEQDGQIKLDL